MLSSYPGGRVALAKPDDEMSKMLVAEMNFMFVAFVVLFVCFLVFDFMS